MYRERAEKGNLWMLKDCEMSVKSAAPSLRSGAAFNARRLSVSLMDYNLNIVTVYRRRIDPFNY